MDITEIAYEKYRLDWMLSHGYTLVDLIAELEKMREEESTTSLQSLFEDWEYGFGFNSEIWVCYEEFMDNEFWDDEYMCELLTTNEFTTYLEYLKENGFFN
jgi:hypothetical protein